MAAAPFAWHVNDVVAYDLMREAATRVQALLIDARSDSAAEELLQVRRATLAIDGFDRAAIDAHTKTLERREHQLVQAASDER